MVFHGLQEKHREKKNKKEKRDKERKETKEKRETERSDGKHKEKKDKKDKHRDKKKEKEKERDKDKEKNSAPDEKRLLGQADSQTGEKLTQKEERDKGRNSIQDEKKIAGHVVGYNTTKLSERSHLAEDTKDSKFVQELGRRINDDDRATENKLVEKFTNLDQRKDEGMFKFVAKGVGTVSEGKEKNKRVDNRKIDGQGIRGEARFSGNSVVPNPLQTRVEGMSRPFQKNVERRVEEKEKAKEKDSDEKRGDKRKNKDKEKKSHGKDKDRDKERKKEEKVKAKNEDKNTQQDKLRESNKVDSIGGHNVTTAQFPKDSSKRAAAEENLKKRKEVEANGVLHGEYFFPCGE